MAVIECWHTRAGCPCPACQEVRRGRARLETKEPAWHLAAPGAALGRIDAQPIAAALAVCLATLESYLAAPEPEAERASALHRSVEAGP